MPVWYLQPVNLGVSDFARQRGLAADDQHAGAECDLDLVKLDPGERDQNRQRVIALEDVTRRLPGGGRAAAVEKLPIKALGAFHRLAGLFPHQRFELSSGHRCLPTAADIVTKSPTGKPPPYPVLGHIQ